MNKKFLSAILFGALMVTSTGTFVSCKDYDDDIENLQTQIDKNSSAIAELQKLVGQGKWVSSISSIENGFTVTMSDGSSHQIKGINGKDGADGKDGKNGTEWTIGEDGFWYVDGAKTENVAVAKDGKNGVTAPAPYINAEGMWVVYTFDAEKGEFVAETTEISAVGTAAYAVEADGVYTLHIADANGEYQEIVLPSTCDSFVVEAPAGQQVYVVSEKAEWKPAKKDKVLAALTEKFPELAELKEGDNLTQGGELPLMVNPTNVDLSEGYTFQLVDVKGKVADITLTNPVAGISDNWEVNMWGEMYSRSADAKGGLWTLSVTPAYDEENETFASITSGALIATNAKGVSSRTAFVYRVYTSTVGDVEIDGNSEVPYAESIDLLATYFVENQEQPAPISFKNEYEGKYLIELTNALQIEKYGLSIAEDGHTLNIAKMPADMTNINITLKVSVVGLNGSTEVVDAKNLKIYQTVAANAELEAKSLELNGKDQIVKWAITDLGMTAVELDKVLSAGLSAEASYEWTDENDEEQSVSPRVSVVYYNKDGKTTRYNGEGKWSNGAATEFGFVVNANNHAWMAPAEYTVKFKAQSGASVIYSAETTLTTSLPEVTDAYIRLTPAFVEEGVLQVTGEVKNGKVYYHLEDAFILKNVEILSITDAEYDDTEEDESVAGFYNWVDDNSNLFVNTWTYEPETYTEGQWYAARDNQLYTTRSMVAKVYFFNNPLNVAEYNFDLVVKSELYSEDATKAITIDGTKLSAIFGYDDATTKDVKENQIDIKKAITKAVVIAGTDKGKTYNLFAVTSDDKVTVTPAKPAVYDYSTPISVSGKLLKGNNIVTLTKVEYLKWCEAFGVTVDSKYNDTNKYELTTTDWAVIWDIAKLFYNTDGTGKYMDKNEDGKIDENDKYDSNGDGTVDSYYFKQTGSKDYKGFINDYTAKMAIYTAFVTKVDFKVAKEAVAAVTKPANPTPRDSRVNAVSFKFVDADEAAKYVTANSDLTVLTAKEEAPSDVTGGKVEIAMIMTVEDTWGMIMEVPFTVTVKTAK